MGVIYVTGDCHSNFSKFHKRAFPQQKHLTREDVVIVAGDFGIWEDTRTERYELDELSNRSFTTLFVDGNHDNMDRLCTEAYKKYMRGEEYTDEDQGEFPLVPLYGGTAQKIRDGVYHLLRGEIYTINGKKILAFGGAASHDISEGILDRDDFKTDEEFYDAAYLWRKTKYFYRINHVSWWKEEMPNDDEKRHAMEQLAKHNFAVDYIVTHCAPTNIHYLVGSPSSDDATNFLQEIANVTQFDKWFFGHYHQDTNVDMDHILLYHSILPVHDSERSHESAFGEIEEDSQEI